MDLGTIRCDHRSRDMPTHLSPVGPFEDRQEMTINLMKSFSLLLDSFLTVIVPVSLSVSFP